MTNDNKITASHIGRSAVVYVRQSSAQQVEHNRESLDRQYKLVDRAIELGWKREQVRIVDEDLGVSGSGLIDRAGFTQMTAEVALGHVGIVVGLEVSRLARNNADWYRLLDLCGATDTLIGDADGIYHPAHFNDRLVLGLKGTMSEAELHILRARLNGGIRNKAARGELRRGLPIGFVWGEEDGEVLFHPDEAVRGAIQTIFARFTELGSARQVWLHFRTHTLHFPFKRPGSPEICWIAPTYGKVHQVLTNPVYAGAYVYGKTRFERYVDDKGHLRKRARKRPLSEWSVLLRDHHTGFIPWETFEANQKRLGENQHPRPHQTGGAVREGAALLQGLAACGRCGRALRVAYNGRNANPSYHCPGHELSNGRGDYCLWIGGRQLDQAVAVAFRKALAPAGLEAAIVAVERIESDHSGAVAQFRLQVERARYETQRAERRYRAVDPENRLVARGLEVEWEKNLRELHAAEAELARREEQHPRSITDEQRAAILSLGNDLDRVWTAPTTTDRDRKELLRTLLEQVIVNVQREKENAHLTMRWRGGVITELNVALPRSHPAPIRTSEDVVELVRRLAVHYSDARIAGILNRQGKTTATGMRFTASRVSSLRTHWKIPTYPSAKQPPSEEDEIVSIDRAAELLGLAPSTIHRWLNDGFIAGEQITPGSPWRIRMTNELRARFVDQTPKGYVPMVDAMRILGVSRQTVLQRVKRGELASLHLRTGRRKGLRIKVPDALPGLFGAEQTEGGAV